MTSISRIIGPGGNTLIVDLSPSEAVVTDASTNLTSMPYSSSVAGNSVASRDINGDSAFRNLTVTELIGGTIKTSLTADSIVQTDDTGILTASNSLPNECSATSMSLAYPVLSGTISTPLTASSLVQTNDLSQLTASVWTTNATDLIPSSDNTSSLGSSAISVKYLYAYQLFGGNSGSAGSLSINGSSGSNPGNVNIFGGNSSSSPTSSNIVTIIGGGSNGGEIYMVGGTNSSESNNQIYIYGSNNNAGDITITATPVYASGTVNITGGNNSTSPTTSNIVNINGGGNNGGTLNLNGSSNTTTSASNVINITPCNGNNSYGTVNINGGNINSNGQLNLSTIQFNENNSSFNSGQTAPVITRVYYTYSASNVGSNSTVHTFTTPSPYDYSRVLNIFGVCAIDNPQTTIPMNINNGNTTMCWYVGVGTTWGSSTTIAVVTGPNWAYTSGNVHFKFWIDYS